jgi:hypothetical protein
VSNSNAGLEAVTASHVSELFSKEERTLHVKVDATRDAYFGFIFPINQADFRAVSDAFGIPHDAARALYRSGREFSTFKPAGRSGQLTNHIFGASILALRGKSLDTGLSSVTDTNLAEIVRGHEHVVLGIAEARASWFGRIYFPAAAFSNAIAVFGGKISADAVYELAAKYGFAAEAGTRRTVRGDFGIGVWLTLLGLAP